MNVFKEIRALWSWGVWRLRSSPRWNFCLLFHVPVENRPVVSGTIIGRSCEQPFLRQVLYTDCFHSIGNTPEVVQFLTMLSGSEGDSGPQVRAAAGGMASGPWRVRGMKLAKFPAIVLTSKDTVDKEGLFLFCSWDESLNAAGTMKETENGLIASTVPFVVVTDLSLVKIKKFTEGLSSRDLTLIVLKLLRGGFYVSAP